MSRLLLQPQPSPIILESRVMSRLPRYRCASFSRYGDAKPGDVVDIFGEKVIVPEPELPLVAKSISDELTPSQQIAILTLRGSDLAKAVLTKLAHSTARASGVDYYALAQIGYAARLENSQRKTGSHLHAITPLGHFKADQLARELAPQLGIGPSQFGLRHVGRRRYGERSTAYNPW